MVEPPRLDLELLFEDLPGITKAGAESCFEAIMICLLHHQHDSGVKCELFNFEETLGTFDLIWRSQIDDKMRRAWGETRNAIEDAAVGLAHLLIPTFTEYTIIQRSNIGEGIDYWLGNKEDAHQFKFQRKARLEVSGILAAQYKSQVTRRARKKIAQSSRSNSSELPVYVIVVEFGCPMVCMVQNDK